MLNFLVYWIKKIYPELAEHLSKSSLNVSVDKFIKRTAVNSLFLSAAVAFLIFLLFMKLKLAFIWLIPIFFIVFFLIFLFILQVPIVYARRKERDINKHILFAIRYLLVKIESGEPLLNAMEKLTSDYGATSEVFREIVNDINMGSTLESAIDKGVQRSPSENLTRALWEISNALKVGIDLSGPLKSMIDQITKEQLIEIQRYTKRLNSLTLFYMVLAVVVPSLGMTMFAVVLSFLKFQISTFMLVLVVFFLAFFQFMFMSLFQSMRPTVEL